MTKSKKKPDDTELQDEQPAQLDDHTPLNVVHLAQGVIIRFEWFESGSWRSKDVDGRIVIPHPSRDPTTTETFKGVTAYHAVDHIQLHHMGCVRCVPFSQVKYWGFEPPLEAAANG